MWPWVNTNDSHSVLVNSQVTQGIKDVIWMLFRYKDVFLSLV